MGFRFINDDCHALMGGLGTADVVVCCENQITARKGGCDTLYHVSAGVFGA